MTPALSTTIDAIPISRERMLAACRDDARRVAGIAAPLFAAGFLLESVSHLDDLSERVFLQPLVSALFCAAVAVLGRRLLPRMPYPELILLMLLWMAVWCIALHLPSAQTPADASTLVMLAVAAVGSATLIMPSVAALFAIGSTTSLYVYAQTLSTGMSVASTFVAPALILLMVTVIHLSRRSAIRSVEELRERVARDQSQLERVNEQLRTLSITDPLTGVLNRRGFDERLQSDIAGAERSGGPLSVLLLDVDNFKDYNDEFGHPAGDAALVQAAAALKACCRGGDSVARYGGEEFALILPATDGPGCQHMADRARRAVATRDSLASPITVSAGGATAASVLMADVDSLSAALVASADCALYRAKEAGRDRAEFNELPILER